ncbi:LacI family DNA-binding transcriptional regulator [Bifidobacterium myosotis]|uniref:LacI family transcriptional regulator n=1 Tax=Bifidobacterium myosotis TaxID=1630166 RepID=A0A5M9ZIJ3_9BIFI|nr:LacI family DNA-binding transcriptional regulator [Bifidobacterium myosotis]KAA8826272.1 LacI family transcriptional regulator [Bifidobacterium myosotis]
MTQRKATDRVRLADVAEEAGVAISTVSRVFGNPDRVNFQTVEHVRAVAERLGYRPNPRRRSAGNVSSAVLGATAAGMYGPAPVDDIGSHDGSDAAIDARRPAGSVEASAAAGEHMPASASGPGRLPSSSSALSRGSQTANENGRLQPAYDTESRRGGTAVPRANVASSRVGDGARRGAERSVEGGIIALVVKDTADGISSQILKGAQVTAMESDSAVSIIETGQSQARTQQMLTHLEGKVDGIILASDSPGIDFIRNYAKRMPLVVLNRPVDGVPSVVPDPRIGVVRALSLLRRYHHTAITYVSGPSASWANQSRWSCLHEVGQRMGFRVNQIGPVHATVEGGYQAALALEGSKPTAVITYNDLIAAGIVLRLGADGVRVPDDVSVIGFDNTLIAPVVTPPITSIRIPRAQLGQAAVRLLLGREAGGFRNPADAQLMERLTELGVRNEDETSDSVTLVDTSIIVRRSVGERRRQDQGQG